MQLSYILYMPLNRMKYWTLHMIYELSFFLCRADFPRGRRQVNYSPHSINSSGKNLSNQHIFTTLFYWAFLPSPGLVIRLRGENVSETKEGWRGKCHSAKRQWNSRIYGEEKRYEWNSFSLWFEKCDFEEATAEEEIY